MPGALFRSSASYARRGRFSIIVPRSLRSPAGAAIRSSVRCSLSHVGGFVLVIYERSLSTVLFVLFVLSFVMHAYKFGSPAKRRNRRVTAPEVATSPKRTVPSVAHVGSYSVV